MQRMELNEMVKSNEKNDSQIEAVVFDMDGVLLDSERLSLFAWEKAAKEINFAHALEAHTACAGLSRSDAYTKLAELYGKNFPAKEFRERASVIFAEMVDTDGLPLMPYAKEILEYLKGKKYPLALASSTRRQVVLKELTLTGLVGYFDYIICGDQVTHSKPDPEIYTLSCKALSFAPENCLAVEDSFNGIISAHAAGMKCAMVVDQFIPDEKIKSLLYKLCSSLENIKDFL